MKMYMMKICRKERAWRMRTQKEFWCVHVSDYSHSNIISFSIRGGPQFLGQQAIQGANLAYFRTMHGPLVLWLFSIFAAITFAPLILLILIFPGRRIYVVPSPWRWIMAAGQLLAGIGTLLAFKNAPHRFFISQQLRKAEKLEPLQKRGIYRYVRDPFLLTGLVQLWLMPVMTIRLLVLLILSSIYLCLGSLHWEMRLGAQFGKEYVEYRKKVPRIIPGVLNRT